MCVSFTRVLPKPARQGESSSETGVYRHHSATAVQDGAYSSPFTDPVIRKRKSLPFRSRWRGCPHPVQVVDGERELPYILKVVRRS
jgi:hypothetical protein